MNARAALLFASTILLSAGTAKAEVPNVVVSIKPIHSLVASLMQGVGQPALIVDGAASPHTFSMKPSHAAALQDADVVFWLGHGFEAFLAKPLEALGDKATVVELEDAPGLEKLTFREGGAFEAHDDEDEAHEGGGHAEGETGQGHDEEAHAEGGHEDAAHAHEKEGHEEAGHDEHGHDETDLHLWLDPNNARALAAEIEKTLTEADPENAATYKANAEALNARFDALDKEITETVAPVKDKPFVVFHDAYQYFEHHYGVKVAGSITVSPETVPGAERIQEIQAKVKSLGATCVFAEPQFEPKLVSVVLEGTDAKTGVLDPEGGTLTAGPDLYFDLMKGIATSLKACLTPAS